MTRKQFQGNKKKARKTSKLLKEAKKSKKAELEQMIKNMGLQNF